MAPFVPSSLGVRTRLAPNSACILRRSIDMCSGMTIVSGIPFKAQTQAQATPLLPEVASMSSVSGPILPAASRASIMAKALRSLTEPAGLKLSILARMVASTLWAFIRRPSFTNGVLPMVSVILS